MCVCVFGGGDKGLAEWPFPLPCWLFPFSPHFVFVLQHGVAPIDR